MIKANRQQILSLLEMLKGFLAFEAQELTEKSDPSIQLPLSNARSDLQVLQNAGALAIVVVDDVQERLSFRWFVFPDPSSSVAPLLFTICAGTKAPQVEAFARGPPAP